MASPACRKSAPADERRILRICRAAPWELICRDWDLLQRLHQQAEPFAPEDKARLGTIFQRIPMPVGRS
jgi:hypothetical protein